MTVIWNNLFFYDSVPGEEIDTLAHYDIEESKVGFLCLYCLFLLFDLHVETEVCMMSNV